MIELRFHHELYDGFAVDEAAKVYGPYGTMELVREPEGFVVRPLSRKRPARSWLHAGSTLRYPRAWRARRRDRGARLWGQP